MLPEDCQIHSIPKMSEEEIVEHLPLYIQLRLMLKRYVPHQTKRKLKRFVSRNFAWLSRDGDQSQPEAVLVPEPAVVVPAQAGQAPAGGMIPLRTIDLEAPVRDADVTNLPGLQAGDRVRVRSFEEIAATTDQWGEMRGCKFMNEMREYCGTTQRVFKSVERMVDERDYKVKRCKGVVLLEGLVCSGTESYGRCDRACFYFWREEWLEKVE